MTQGMVVKHCNRLLREATDAPALETFKAKHSKALKNKNQCCVVFTGERHVLNIYLKPQEIYTSLKKKKKSFKPQ